MERNISTCQSGKSDATEAKVL